MLKLSKRIDYGLIAMSYIALTHDTAAVNTKRIADEYHIPVELLAKVLQRLAKKGLIISQNGPKGGYALSRPSTDITVSEIIEAIEGPVMLTTCSLSDTGDGGVCDQWGLCNVRSPLHKIQDGIRKLLQSMTLAEMSQLSRHEENSYGLEISNLSRQPLHHAG
ncbi:MAG: Rrf2 family transcriptional regulator [Nitrospiria bacterium]